MVINIFFSILNVVTGSIKSCRKIKIIQSFAENHRTIEKECTCLVYGYEPQCALLGDKYFKVIDIDDKKI